MNRLIRTKGKQINNNLSVWKVSTYFKLWKLSELISLPYKNECLGTLCIKTTFALPTYLCLDLTRNWIRFSTIIRVQYSFQSSAIIAKQFNKLSLELQEPLLLTLSYQPSNND